MSCSRLAVVSAFLALLIQSVAMAQMEYLSSGKKSLVTDVSCFSSPGPAIWGGEVVYSSDGRIGVGAVFAMGSSARSYALGADIIGSILKADERQPVGVEALFSYAYDWLSVDETYMFGWGPNDSYVGGTTSSRYFSGNTIVVGAEVYLSLFPDSNSTDLEPFLDLTRSFATIGSGDYHASNSYNSYGAGVNIVVYSGAKQEFVITPGALYHQSRLDLGASMGIVFRLN